MDFLTTISLGPKIVYTIIDMYHENTRIGPEEMKDISAILTSPHNKVKFINISLQYIYSQGLIYLSKGLASPYCNLCHLQCNVCRIGDEGITTLCKALLHSSNFSSLHRLYFANNYIGDKGAKYLALLISSSHNRIKSLHLKKNIIGDKGALCLATAMRSKHSVLTSLNLDENMISKKGVLGLSNVGIHYNPADAAYRAVIPPYDLAKWRERLSLQKICWMELHSRHFDMLTVPRTIYINMNRWMKNLYPYYEVNRRYYEIHGLSLEYCHTFKTWTDLRNEFCEEKCKEDGKCVGDCIIVPFNTLDYVL